MKRYFLKLLLGTTLLLAFNACSDRRLDIAPLDILSTEQVFGSPAAIDAYMASLYNDLPMEDYNFRRLAVNTDEAIQCFAGQQQNIGDGTNTPWWNYAEIRNINDFISKITIANITDELKQHLKGEAFFLRAYCYFQMAKRYGGVPVVKEVLNYTGDNLQELQVPRSTEKDVYDFVSTDLDTASSLLPETNVPGRASKYTALALKSRAMLYAGSIATYGSVQLNGLVGIPAEDADKYWKFAFDAAAKVIQSGVYALYNKSPDKGDNYAALFLDGSNPEAIFTRFYSYPAKTHSYDRSVIPFGVRGPDGYSSDCDPTLDLVMQYENKEGTPFVPNIGTPDAPVYYTNPTDLFANIDPRFWGTIIPPFDDWRGNVIDVQAGIYDNGNKWEAGDYAALFNTTTHLPDNTKGTLHIVGLSGFGGAEKTQTGFYIRKYMDPSLEQSLVRTNGSSQQWIDIRYAEVLLNYAEAAIELKNVPEATKTINQIRERAGIHLLSEGDINVDRVRHERLVELAFENQRWWDYRRWRVFDKIVNNTWPTALKPYYDIQHKAYRFEKGRAGKYARTFYTKVYYEKIDPGNIAKNPKLVQNPNY